MTSPHLRGQITTALLAGVLVAIVMLAVPSDQPLHADLGAAEPPAEDYGRLLAERRGGPATVPSRPEVESPELADPLYESQISAKDSRHAANAALRFTIAYASRRYDEPAEERAAQLAPLLTDDAARILSSGSTGLAEHHDRQHRQEVAEAELAFLNPIQLTRDRATYLVALRVTTSDTTGAASHERTYTIATVRAGPNWLITDVLP